jgi:molybdenum cofactor cytidylyltransferase
MILLADLPHVTSRLINLLINRYLESRLPIGAIQVKSKRSHPVIFGRPLYNELRKLQGDMGARALFQKYGDRACLVQPDFFYDDMDIDTEEDYAEFQKSLKNQVNVL